MDIDEKTLSFLPPRSRQKAEFLVMQWNAAFDISRGANERVEDARRALMENQRAHASAALNHGRRADPLSGLRALVAEDTAPEEPEQVARARRELQREIGRRDAIVDEIGLHAIDAAIHWARDAQRKGLKVRDAKLPHVGGERDPRGYVHSLREQLAGIEDQWTAAEHAPLPLAEAQALVLAELDKTAAVGKPSINLANRASPVNLARELQAAKLASSDSAMMVGDYGMAFFTWVHRNAIRDRIFAELGETDAPGALSDDARAARLRELSAQRLLIERQEEAAICAAHRIGMMIARRDDADPRALLEVDA